MNKSLLVLLLTARLTQAQTTSAASPITLAQAVERSLTAYPSIRVSQEQMNAASAGIKLARTAYLPRVDALAQLNRATRNNVFGLLLPQSVIPSMSGPVIGSNNLGSAWGSAVGVLVSWEPFDFGLRSANISTARAALHASQAAVKVSQFEVVVSCVDAYLTLVAAQQTVTAAAAGVTRAETVSKTIGVQVKAELRPGADQSRADAELAAARTQLSQAQQAAEVARATLAQFTGIEPSKLSVEQPSLIQLPPEQSPAPQSETGNPVFVQQNAVIEQARAQLRALERSYFPAFHLQAASYARGTGAETNGDRLGGLNGLAPSVQDYALGFTVTFPVMDFAALHAREAEQNAAIRAQTARAEQIAVDLKAQWNRAVANESGARRVAANTPLQVTAARAASRQATARYQAGLANMDEVAEAQRLLTQAEIDDVLARLGVWRGLLGIATAAGDLQPFVSEVSR